MESDIHNAIDMCADFRSVASRIKTLDTLGLGYLTLGKPRRACRAARLSD